MIVLSDGHPAGHGDMRHLNAHLTEVVKKLTASGVEMFGIGIMDNSVAGFYPNYSVVKDLNDLPVTVMTTLEKMLLANQK